MKEIQKKIISINEYIIAFLLILGTNTIYFSTIKINFHINILTALFIIIYFFNKYIFDTKWKKMLENITNIFKKNYGIIIAIYLFLTIFALFNNINNKNFISLYFVILPILIVIYKENINIISNIMNKIVKITVVLSLISLVCYFTIDVLHIVNYTGKVDIAWDSKSVNSFLNIYFNTQKYSFNNYTITRNTGIFTEAPMYSLVLIIALAYLELFTKNTNNINILRTILIITILTTFSTTGYISMLLIYLFKLINQINKNTKNKKKIILGIVLSMIIFSILSFILLNNRLKTASGSIRIDDYISSYKAWINNDIIFGVGYRNEDEIIKYMSGFRNYNHGLSNSFMVVLAEGGLYLLSLYIVPLILCNYFAIKQKKYNINEFSCIIFLLFLTTIFFHSSLMMNILAIGIVYIIKSLSLKGVEK